MYFDHILMDFTTVDASVYCNPHFNNKQDQEDNMEPGYTPFQPFRVIIDPQVMDICRNDTPNLYFPTMKQFDFGVDVVRYKKLNHSSPEFKNIQLLFSNISYYKLTDVEVVFNPYLKKKFELRRQLVFGGIQPIRLFHGTKEKYIDSICNHNFDWRCYRRNRHRYGKGVNFTPDIGYAAIYCDKRKGKIMIMADVLVKKIAHGNKRTIVPPVEYDTTEGKKGVVIVKYHDNEFYPQYLIYFIRLNGKTAKDKYF